VLAESLVSLVPNKIFLPPSNPGWTGKIVVGDIPEPDEDVEEYEEDELSRLYNQ
jgi:hypothetical protein